MCIRRNLRYKDSNVTVGLFDRTQTLGGPSLEGTARPYPVIRSVTRPLNRRSEPENDDERCFGEGR